MTLKEAVESILTDQKRTLTWLATEMDKTYTGFKLSLENETVKFSDLKKMLKVLNVPVTMLFENTDAPQNANKKYTPQDSAMLGEPDHVYRRNLEGLEKQVKQLESQLTDKDKIIELLSEK